jgi:hypothetical protein
MKLSRASNTSRERQVLDRIATLEHDPAAADDVTA